MPSGEGGASWCTRLPRSEGPNLFQSLLDALLGLPPISVYGTIGLLAALENVIPPVPADTAVAAGAFLSRGGRISAVSVFLITWIMNVGSAALVYTMARRVGRPFFQGPMGRRLLRPSAFQRIELWYGKYGSWGIFLSRFVPAARAMVPPFAGVAGLSPVRTLVPLTAASGLWYGALTWAAFTLISGAGDIARFMTQLNRTGLIAIGVLLVVATGFIAFRWWKGRKARA